MSEAVCRWMGRGAWVAVLGFCAAMPMYASQTTITIGGSEQFALPTTWDGGTFSLTINGHTESIGYGQFSTAQSVASGLAAKFSLDCTSPVVAKAQGALITFITKHPDESFEQASATSVWNTAAFSAASFNIVTPPPPTTTASPTPSLSFSCTPDPVASGGSADCTARLPQGATGTVSFSLDGAAPWSTAEVDGTGFAPASTLSALQAGTHTLLASYSGDGSYNATTQTISLPVLTGSLVSSTVYSYSITQLGGTSSGYAPNGDILAYTDSVNGSWSLQYDGLNRLVGGTTTSAGTSTVQNWCWTYDSFGNRQLEATAATAFGSSCSNTGSTTTDWATYNASNQITGTPVLPAGLVYDAAGDVTNDGTNSYLYDAEGRVCAVATRPLSGGTTMYQYIYDADGLRVAKGTITSFSCDMTVNGYAPTNSYVLGQGGEQITEMTVVAGQGVWAHTNVYAGGMLLGTYDPQGLHFHITDWLGNRRLQTNAFGQVEETCTNSPFGNRLNCTFPSGAPTTADDATEQHFTGHEHDAESGLDYFGARYLGSGLARFMTPDWSAKAEPVPYAQIDDPQSLNLYAYVQNNPLGLTDPTGHHLFDMIHTSAEAHEEAYETELEEVEQEAKAQQQNNNSSSSGHGFWSHVSNLFHGHSWNYGMRESVTVTILPAEPIPAVTAATDAAGIVGLASETAGKVLGPAGAAVSIANDRSHQNVITNVLSLVPGFEGMGVVGAFNDFFDYGANHSRPGPQKVGDPSVPSELQPTLPTQDGGCLAAGGAFPC